MLDPVLSMAFSRTNNTFVDRNIQWKFTMDFKHEKRTMRLWLKRKITKFITINLTIK